MSDSSASPPTGNRMARLAASRTVFAALRPRVEAGEPWPLAPAFGTEPEAAWGPREVLAHTAEMLPFWLGEYERIVEATSRDTGQAAVGRLATDPLRLGVLERDRTLPLRELFDRIDAGIERWERRLSAGSTGEGGAVGLHPRLGEVTADELCDHFVVAHLDEHAAQLVAALDGEPAAG